MQLKDDFFLSLSPRPWKMNYNGLREWAEKLMVKSKPCVGDCLTWDKKAKEGNCSDWKGDEIELVWSDSTIFRDIHWLRLGCTIIITQLTGFHFQWWTKKSTNSCFMHEMCQKSHIRLSTLGLAFFGGPKRVVPGSNVFGVEKSAIIRQWLLLVVSRPKTGNMRNRRKKLLSIWNIEGRLAEKCSFSVSASLTAGGVGIRFMNFLPFPGIKKRSLRWFAWKFYELKAVWKFSGFDCLFCVSSILFEANQHHERNFLQSWL